MIPVEYRLHGDRQQCEALRGQGRRVMHVLENMMRLGKLDQQTIRFIPEDGSLIVARQFFGKRIVDIYAGEGAFPPPPPKEKVCICNCNLSVGWILEVQTSDTISGAQLYTVMACNNDGRSYIPYRDVLATDWTPYELGQKVLMVPYYTMGFLCCTNKDGPPRGCKPVVSEYETEDDEWRTTYRILPFCAIRIPTLIDPLRWKHNG